MSISRKSAHNSPSSPSLVVEMSSFSEKPKLQKVMVDSMYVTTKKVTQPRENEFLLVAKVLLQLMGMLAGLYLLIFVIMTGFSLVKPAPEYIPGTSFLNVRVVDTPNVPFLMSDSIESDLPASYNAEEDAQDVDEPHWVTFPQDVVESAVSTQAPVSTSTSNAPLSMSTTKAPISTSTTETPLCTYTTNAPICTSTTEAPFTTGTTTSTPQVRRQLPKRSPMSESFLAALRNKTEEVYLYLDDAEQYCLPNTSLANCELDWPKLRSYMPQQVGYLNLSSSTNTTSNDTYDECFEFTTKEEMTCFSPFNGTHSEVRLTELIYKPGTLQVETTKEVKLYARYILAIGPQDFILVTGDAPDQFCFLTLFDHSCETYEYMVDSMITS